MPAIEVEREVVATAHCHVSEVRAHSAKGIAEVTKAIEAGCDGLTMNWPDWLIHEQRPEAADGSPGYGFP